MSTPPRSLNDVVLRSLPRPVDCCRASFFAVHFTVTLSRDSLTSGLRLSVEGSPRMPAWGRVVRPGSGWLNLICTVHGPSRISSDRVDGFWALGCRLESFRG
eukprot:scaffold1148_cov335-Pavlova_lutheri.AAC.6